MQIKWLQFRCDYNTIEKAIVDFISFRCSFFDCLQLDLRFDPPRRIESFFAL